MEQNAWQGAGEDWPDAYRQSPISPSEALGCVVCFWHHQWEKPAFQLYGSLLFGLPLAVTSFNRYSKLVEALGRRLLRSLVSMHFDDAHITDLLSNASQWALEELNILLGTPFAEDKRQPFASGGTFLGPGFDFSTVRQTNCVTFWAVRGYSRRPEVSSMQQRKSNAFPLHGHPNCTDCSTSLRKACMAEWDVEV
jgi:hypothetical protein